MWNLFDATQGQSSGVQVNAIHESGSNRLWACSAPTSATAASTLRTRSSGESCRSRTSSTLTSLGGAIITDKLHYFVNFEYEQAPQTSIAGTRLPRLQHRIDRHEHAEARWHSSRLSAVAPDTLDGKDVQAQELGAPLQRARPTVTRRRRARTTNATRYIGHLAQVLEQSDAQRGQVDTVPFGFRNELLTEWSKHWQAPRVTNGHPRITLTGFSIAGNANYPRHRDQRVSFLRDDFMYAFDARGRHDLKAGAEWVRHFEDTENCNQCGGAINATNGIIPAPLLQAIFPDPFDTDTWLLAALSPFLDLHHRHR